MEQWIYFMLLSFAMIGSAAASASFDFGDTLALIIGLIAAIIIFFACMGAYARRQSFRPREL